MARTQCAALCHRAFFINVVDNDFLNFRRKPAGLGLLRLRSGQRMDVVDKIKAVATGRSGMHHVPKDDVIIKSVTVSE